LVLFGLVAYGIFNNLDINSGQRNFVKKEKSPKYKYDTVLVKRFNNVCKWLDTERQECLIQGAITVTDHADSMSTSGKIDYLFSKKGNQFYYRSGTNELVSSKAQLLNIDHLSKRVFVSANPGENVNTGSLFKSGNIKQLIEGFKKEGYQLNRQIKGSKETLSLVNSNNISCRQYSVTFDTLDLKPLQVMVSIPNLEYFTNKNKDKIMLIRLLQLSDESQIESYTSKNYLIKTPEGPRLSGDLKGYQLIQR